MADSRLAMFGGTRTVDADAGASESTAWPIVTDAEREAVLGVLDSGRLTSVEHGEVQLLEQEWAQYVGVRHCAALSSGTAAIELALVATGIEPGAEVLVPAFSFIATASAPVLRGCVPVYVDIDPVTYTIDPVAAAAAITPRTQAILAVHLHGLPCDMDALRALADRHGLVLIEDAAQAHGATYHGRQAGALGDVAAFSLNASKNLPTSGEGGLITTDDPEILQRVLLHRQFGEELTGRGERAYLSTVVAGNAKLSTIQAAFTRCQLARLAERHEQRDRNVRRFLDRLAALDGIVTPHCPPDRTHAWFQLRLRFDNQRSGCPDVSPGALRTILQRALRAEGVPVRPYQSLPLPAQPALRAVRPADQPYRPQDHPTTLAVIEDSLTIQRWHLNPAAGPLLDRCADAFEKVWEQRELLLPAARSMTYRPLWQQLDRTAAQA
ncbi:DegT/DnrJ/EryC1/StrS family aminotransferase [Kitasatospora viridis]|uniref:dTDP-4-amino-4,6-dideoxygalactose transaminase n=1 Tax=Kitasatospora viridis TaxID=281105 RepID=A0A561UCM1_9ACTN|nr:DegT/DnrJ/EryC1/StrS family aminotransferase [Kitasatospora viridis]TWF97099.1 dTDP-4-amino-4,6-dideoxygalactose transaminase [Kitasatospora viridis]